MAVDPMAKLDFPRALRHIVRQDPDIIMVGEIRDPETAEIAARAAITGHLVLSTLHTNDAAGVFPRLVDMKVEPFIVADALNGVIAQRLVRRLCPLCKQIGVIGTKMAQLLKLPDDMSAHIPVGCNQCGMTGYKGRFALYEYISVDDEMRLEMGQCNYDLSTVNMIMRKRRKSILENGIANIALGNTTAEEVIRVVFRE